MLSWIRHTHQFPFVTPKDGYVDRNRNDENCKLMLARTLSLLLRIYHILIRILFLSIIFRQLSIPTDRPLLWSLSRWQFLEKTRTGVKKVRHLGKKSFGRIMTGSGHIRGDISGQTLTLMTQPLQLKSWVLSHHTSPLVWQPSVLE